MTATDNNNTPILFRWHRQLLEDSMATVREIKDFAELEALVHEQYESTGLVEVKWYADDQRIKWNTYLVTLDGHAVGYTNHALEKHSLAS